MYRIDFLRVEYTSDSNKLYGSAGHACYIIYVILVLPFEKLGPPGPIASCGRLACEGARARASKKGAGSPFHEGIIAIASPGMPLGCSGGPDDLL